MVPDALDITEEEAQGLAELARHDLAMARAFAARAQAAEDADEANRLARSYQRAARSYRQTLALKARLKRDLAQAAAAQATAAQVQAAAPRPRPGGAAVAQRIGELRKALLRLSWEEAERPETEGEVVQFADAREMFGYLRQEVEAVVAEACLRPDFCDEAVDDHVARLALRFNFAPEAIARWRELPDPPPAGFDAEAGDLWQSSA